MSERIIRVNELVKIELSQILLEERFFDPSVLVTVMSVDTSDTIEDSTVWISVLPKDREGYVLETLKSESRHIQQILNRRIEMRFVPRIHWKIDHSESYVEKIDEAFKHIED